MFAGNFMVGLVGDSWPRLLARVKGGDLFALFDQLLSCGRPGWVIEEVDRRTAAVPVGADGPLLFFYQAVAEWLQDSEEARVRLAGLVDSASPEEQARLRTASLRLARLIREEPVRLALSRFHFGSGAEPDEDLEFNQLMDYTLEGFEALLDEIGIRGMPAPMIRKLGREAKRDIGSPVAVQVLAAMFEDQKKLLSREAKLFLYG